jgi:acetyl-CoA carboxylase biotin carboxyl carrier protein
MSSTGGGAGDVFDVRKIRRLVELMNEHELAEIDLRQADQRIRLRRGGSLSAAPPLESSARVAAALPATDAAQAGGATVVDEAHLLLIRSPMVGTFYTSASPESPPYVKVGDRVEPDTTVCIVEAMKVFNEIPAECSGQVVALLVENGEPVEYGQPLFRVSTKL